MANIRQAVILSAGLGTRLRPLTEKTPKVMLPVGGRPLLEDHIEQFKKHGVTEFFINLHHLPKVVKEYFGDGRKWGVSITYAYEPELRGTAGGIKNFEGRLHGNFFVIYGDMFSRLDYSRMANTFKAHKDAIGIVAIGDHGHPHDSDLVEIDENSRILTIHQKPHASLPSRYHELVGVYIFRDKILSHIPSNVYFEIDHNLLPELLRIGEVILGCETKESLLDTGTMERYRKVQEFVEKESQNG